MPHRNLRNDGGSELPDDRGPVMAGHTKVSGVCPSWLRSLPLGRELRNRPTAVRGGRLVTGDAALYLAAVTVDGAFPSSSGRDRSVPNGSALFARDVRPPPWGKPERVHPADALVPFRNAGFGNPACFPEKFRNARSGSFFRRSRSDENALLLTR